MIVFNSRICVYERPIGVNWCEDLCSPKMFFVYLSMHLSEYVHMQTYQ